MNNFQFDWFHFHTQPYYFGCSIKFVLISSTHSIRTNTLQPYRRRYPKATWAFTNKLIWFSTPTKTFFGEDFDAWQRCHRCSEQFEVHFFVQSMTIGQSRHSSSFPLRWCSNNRAFPLTKARTCCQIVGTDWSWVRWELCLCQLLGALKHLIPWIGWGHHVDTCHRDGFCRVFFLGPKATHCPTRGIRTTDECMICGR